MAVAKQTPHHSIIIGSGFSGICMAIRLQEAGVSNFLILEKSNEVGGTWRDNHYPGAECDVPSALYSYSFEKKTDWNYQWSEQPQILDYIRRVVDKHALEPHIRFSSELTKASYDAGQALWLLTLASGETLATRFLISAVCQLHRPKIPSFPGQDSYHGIQFHSARWRDDVDLQGKSVAVIGNAASAVQFIPHVAKKAAKLTIYQRSANWVAEKRDRPYTEREKSMMRAFPFIKSLQRLRTYLRNELIVYPALRGVRLNAWLMRMACLSYLKKNIEDAHLREKLTPHYPIGAKRILTATGYYEALAQDNVELVTGSIDHFDESAIITTDGRHRDHDVVIYGTGFVTNPFLEGIAITGRSGRTLSDHWSRGAHAYLGIATTGFPNLFFLYGPNTNLGHNSILLMTEAQAGYIVTAIQAAEGKHSLEVRENIESRYNQEIQQRLAEMVWSRIDSSWYKSGDLVTNNWPGTVAEYRRRMRRFIAADFILD